MGIAWPALVFSGILGAAATTAWGAACEPASSLPQVPRSYLAHTMLAPATGAVISAEAVLKEMIDTELKDPAGLCRYRAADLAIGNTTNTRIVFLGDSITQFWAIAEPGLFTRGFAARGIGGQRVWQMLLRLRQDVLALHPAAVHLLAGTNDIFSLSAITTVASVEDNYRDILELCALHGITVILGAVPPIGGAGATAERQRARNELTAWLIATARQRHLQYIDYDRVLRGADGLMDPDMSIDGVHPNLAGFRAMTALALAALRPYCGKTCPAPE